MATLAELMVKVGVSSQEFTKGVQKMSKDARAFGKQMEELGNQIKTGLAIGTAAAVGGFGALVVSGIKANANLEAYRNTLNTVMGDSEKAGQTLDWVKKYAAKTPFELPGLVESTVKLSAMGLEAEKFIPVAADMAAVFQSSGKTVGQAAEAINDAVMGEFERLKEFGIKLGAADFKAGGKYAGKTYAEAVMEEVRNHNYTGAAEGLSNTFAGRMSTLKDTIGNFIQQATAPAFERLSSALGNVMKHIDQLQASGKLDQWVVSATAAINGMINVLAAVGGVAVDVARFIIDNWSLIGPAVTIAAAAFLAYKAYIIATEIPLKMAAAAQWALNIAMRANPIGLVIAAITGLITAGVLLYKNWDTVKAKASALWTAIKTAFNSIKTKVLEVAKNAIQWGRDIIDGLIAGIKQKIDSVKNIVSELANTIISKIESVLDMHSPSKVMAEVGENIGAGLIQGMRKASADVRNSAMELVNGMLGSVKQVTDQFNQSVAQAMETFRQQEEQLTQQYQQQLDSRTQSLYSWIGIFDEVPEKMKVTGAELLENLKGQVQYFTDWQTGIAELSKKAVDEGLIKELQEMGPKALPQIEALSSMTDTELASYVTLWQEKHKLAKEQSTTELTDLKTETWNKIEELRTNTNTQLAQYALDFLKKIGEVKTESLARLGEMAAKGVTIGSDLISNIIKGVISKKETLQNQIAEIAEMMSFLPTAGNGLPYVQPYVPALAAGGIVTRPTLAMIGEAGPEAVIPLSRGGAGATTNHITVNINGAQNPDAVFRELERRLARAGVRL